MHKIIATWVIGFFVFNFGQVHAQVFENDYQYITLAEIVPDTMDGWILNDSLERVSVKKWYFNTIISNNEVDESRIQNEVLVTQEEKSILFTQLFAPAVVNAIREEADCYEPRHAVCFYSEKDVLVGVVEVCFECFKTKEAGICIDSGVLMYAENYTELRKLFATKGLAVTQDYNTKNYQYHEH